MTATKERVEKLAALANAALHRIGTEDGKRGRIVAKSDAPTWLSDLCHEAHGPDMLPDDWRYEFIQDALSVLEDDGDAENEIDLDSAYPYTHDRLAWLSSRNDRTAYCDEAVEEFGLGGETLGMDSRIAWGMWKEMGEVFESVKQWLHDRADEDEQDEEARAAEAEADQDAE